VLICIIELLIADRATGVIEDRPIVMGARSWVDPFDAEAVTLYFKRLGAKKSHRDTADEYGRVHVGSVRSISKAREGGCRVRGASASTTCASRGSSLCCVASLCEVVCKDPDYNNE
jgi:hypothetical protein